MKKTQRILATIISFIILTFFVGTVQAQVCTGDYEIDPYDTSGDIAALSSCTEVNGNLSINYTALTSLSGLGNLTVIGGDLEIVNNDALTSLSGLESLITIGNHLYINSNNVLINLCDLYKVTLAGDELAITNNLLISMDDSVVLEMQLRNNGFTGVANMYNNVGVDNFSCNNDNDNDDVIGAIDNCPYRYNTDQSDCDGDGIGDVCDMNTQDRDGDGIDNNCDNCVDVKNVQQLDADNDGVGDLCDSTSGCGGCGQSVCETTCSE